jgi:hypothetical protein
VVIEYKGYFSTVNRLAAGQYIGFIEGLSEGKIELSATSICHLRQKFEAAVDAFLLITDLGSLNELSTGGDTH